MDVQADSRWKYPRSRLLASSAGRGWSTIAAELRSHPAGRIASGLQQSVEIVIAIRGADDGFVVRSGAGRQQQTRPASGTIWLAPIGIGDEEITITAPIPEALHLYLPARQFNLLAEMTRESSTGRMFAETASLLLAARLAHSYADGSVLDPRTGPAHRLDNARLRRVLDHIDRHLEEEITVADLARLANLSTFHFSRMFTAAIGLPPCRFVGRRRLENAMAMLAVGKLPLSEIAHRSGFSSQASFSRAFRRATGMTPGEYRRLVH